MKKDIPEGMEECNTCNGEGEAVFSCCGGDVVTGDLMMCPTCHEHLGPEECPDCGGEGFVKAEDQTNPTKVDPQLQAENHGDWIRDMVEAGHTWSLD